MFGEEGGGGGFVPLDMLVLTFVASHVVVHHDHKDFET